MFEFQFGIERNERDLSFFRCGDQSLDFVLFRLNISPKMYKV